jgi:hypothetical protein
LRRSTRIRHPIERYVGYESFSLDHHIFLTETEKQNKPRYFLQAAKNKRWVEAMNEKIQALHECQTWEIVRRSPDKIKHKPDRSTERYEACM